MTRISEATLTTLQDGDLAPIARPLDNRALAADIGAAINTKISEAVLVATETVTGILKIARVEDVASGDDDTRAVTPAKLKTIAPQVADDALPLRSVDYSEVEATCKLFGENIATWSNPGGGNNNVTYQWGYNNAAGGGREAAGDGAFYLQMETNYRPSSVDLFEYHLNAYTAADAVICRPFSYIVAKDGSTGTAIYSCDDYYFNDLAGTQMMKLDANGYLNFYKNGIQIALNDVVALKQYNSSGVPKNIAYIDSYGNLILGDSGLTVFTAQVFQCNNDLVHYGTKVGFFSAGPQSKPTGVAVTASAIHAALVTLGLIAA
jgi:hypothetical protein